MAAALGNLMRLYGGAAGQMVVDNLKPLFTPVVDHPAGVPIGFETAEVVVRPGTVVSLYSISAGGSFPLHDAGAPVDVVILRGAGTLALGDGTTIPYRAGDVFLFEPGSPHAWHTVTEDTVMLGLAASNGR